MRLLVLHGPPAAGKLAVGREVAQQLRFRLFHNHFTHDLATSLFDFGTAEFYELVEQVRLEALVAAARAGVSGVVFTFAYTDQRDDAFLERLQETLAPLGADVAWVYLNPPTTVLEQRIVSADRAMRDKARTVDGLHRLLARYDYSGAPRIPSLIMDNSELSPSEAAAEICRYLETRGWLAS